MYWCYIVFGIGLRFVIFDEILVLFDEFVVVVQLNIFGGSIEDFYQWIYQCECGEYDVAGQDVELCCGGEQVFCVYFL